MGGKARKEVASLHLPIPLDATYLPQKIRTFTGPALRHEVLESSAGFGEHRVQLPLIKVDQHRGYELFESIHVSHGDDSCERIPQLGNRDLVRLEGLQEGFRG